MPLSPAISLFCALLCVYEALQCKICCVAPMHRPICAKCCKQLLGCEPCVNTCFSENGANKPCPNCSTERRLMETSRICWFAWLAWWVEGCPGKLMNQQTYMRWPYDTCWLLIFIMYHNCNVHDCYHYITLSRIMSLSLWAGSSE